MAKEKNKIIIGVICVITIGLAIASNVLQIIQAYHPSNMTQIEYLKENVEPDDKLVFNAFYFGPGSVVALHFTNNKQYYYNTAYWALDDGYIAFGDQFQVCRNTDFLNGCTGRVWIIDSEESDVYNQLFNNEDFKLISRKNIDTCYLYYKYNIILVERVQ